MNTNIEVMRELDELVEAARLLGVTQAKKVFGCYMSEERRFERAMYESIDKHRAALLAERDALAAENAMLRQALEGMTLRAQDRDGTRLDWLQQHDERFYNLLRITSVVNQGFSPTNSGGKRWFSSIREAIDAAMRKEMSNDR